MRKGKKEKVSVPVNIQQTDKETVFFNQPADQDADVVHEIIPEIRVAKEIFKVPETAEKLKEVSRKIKVVDNELRIRRSGTNGRVGAPSISPVSAESGSPDSVEPTYHSADESKGVDETIASTAVGSEISSESVGLVDDKLSPTVVPNEGSETTPHKWSFSDVCFMCWTRK
jgi:hypothetical protein